MSTNRARKSRIKYANLMLVILQLKKTKPRQILRSGRLSVISFFGITKVAMLKTISRRKSSASSMATYGLKWLTAEQLM
jgi:hypothetical protein